MTLLYLKKIIRFEFDDNVIETTRVLDSGEEYKVGRHSAREQIDSAARGQTARHALFIILYNNDNNRNSNRHSRSPASMNGIIVKTKTN